VAEEDSLAEESGESDSALGKSHGHGGPAHGAPLAVVATRAVGAEDLSEEPGLNPYQPNQRRKVPRTTRDVLVAAKCDGAAAGMVESADSRAFDEGTP
jgi:hypothetical protein